MITNKKELREYIQCETSFLKYRFLAFIPFDLFESQIIARYLVLLRKAEYHVNCNHFLRKIVSLFLLKRKQCRYGVHIPVNVFGKGLSIGHLGSIVVNEHCRVGENCRIHVGVVLGANGENTKGKLPVLGNNVYLAPGVKVFGAVQIADNCRIGANAVVNKSCNVEGALLVGIPAVIKNKN